MTVQQHQKLLLVGSFKDKDYIAPFRPCIGTASAAAIFDAPSTYYELKAICQSKGATAVVSTNVKLLEKLVTDRGADIGRKKPSIDNYAGSLFQIPNSDIPVVFINPLEQLHTVSYSRFLTEHYISKLIKPETWQPETEFKWELYDAATFQDTYIRWGEAFGIAIDIETRKEPPSIKCVGYTAIFQCGDSFVTESLVIPCDSLYNLAAIRRINSLPCPKIFQNGKYDIAYLQAYDAAPVNYLWDTAEFFHSWYAELPKDLGSLAAFFIRNCIYWKDLAETSDLHTYYQYCALDTWGTANVFLAWFALSPQWAKNNYANTFPLQFPCHLAEMTGIARDEQEMEIVRADVLGRIESKKKQLEVLTATPNFNSNSPVQVATLLRILGCGDLPSTEEMYLKKAILRHPLNAKILNLILDVRGDRKLVSTYLRTDADKTKQNPKGNKEFYGHLRQYHPTTGRKPKTRGRILFALNPHGTDTGRLASKEHHFWCGLQVQNIPRGIDVKRTLIADNGFVIAEADLEQAESRDTAHIAGDESLIAAVSGSRDFHSINASAFFGVPYDSIYDDSKRKTIDKILRDLSKRVNHGANYNMGPDVLVDTMGLDKIWEAQRVLKLPKLWTPKQVAEHLLGVFHATYPNIKRVYYVGVAAEVMTTKMLKSTAIHNCPYQANKQGLFRYCFGNPAKNKRDLNAYVAHPPQSLNAMTLNRAYMKVFYEIALNPRYSADFKLGPQIHDSILFQYRKGKDEIPALIKDAMEIPVTVRGYDLKTRTFTVPAAVKAGKDGTGANRWSETE